MPLKKGQKLTDNPRNVRLEVRLTQGESKMLTETAEQMGATKTEVIVEGIEAVAAKLESESPPPKAWTARQEGLDTNTRKGR